MPRGLCVPDAISSRDHEGRRLYKPVLSLACPFRRVSLFLLSCVQWWGSCATRPSFRLLLSIRTAYSPARIPGCPPIRGMSSAAKTVQGAIAARAVSPACAVGLPGARVRTCGPGELRGRAHEVCWICPSSLSPGVPGQEPFAIQVSMAPHVKVTLLGWVGKRGFPGEPRSHWISYLALEGNRYNTPKLHWIWKWKDHACQQAVWTSYPSPQDVQQAAFREACCAHELGEYGLNSS